MRLALRNILFALVVPAAGAVYAPWLILTSGGVIPRPVVWPAVAPIMAGVALYAACQWMSQPLATEHPVRGMRRGDSWRSGHTAGSATPSTSRHFW